MFTFPVRVYYEDTDAGGIVFYANYLKFFERARTEWLRHLGVNQSTLVKEYQCIFVVVATDVNYRSPARLDDLLEIRSYITHIGSSSVSFDQQAYCADRLLAESKIRICCIDAQTFKPKSLPESIKLLLKSNQESAQ